MPIPRLRSTPVHRHTHTHTLTHVHTKACAQTHSHKRADLVFSHAQDISLMYIKNSVLAFPRVTFFNAYIVFLFCLHQFITVTLRRVKCCKKGFRTVYFQLNCKFSSKSTRNDTKATLEQGSQGHWGWNSVFVYYTELVPPDWTWFKCS